MWTCAHRLLRCCHYPTPAAILAGVTLVAAVAGRQTRLAWRVRLAPPNAPPLPQTPRWFGCVDWLPQHDAIHAPPALLAGLVGPPLPRPWQHLCVVEQLDPVTLVWSDVRHVNMGEDADDCYASNAWCPIDGASGAPLDRFCQFC